MISPLHLDHFWVEELIVKSIPPEPGGSHPDKQTYLFREVDFDVDRHLEKNLLRCSTGRQISKPILTQTPRPHYDSSVS